MIRMVNQLTSRALDMRASDIYIEPLNTALDQTASLQP